MDVKVREKSAGSWRFPSKIGANRKIFSPEYQHAVQPAAYLPLYGPKLLDTISAYEDFKFVREFALTTSIPKRSRMLLFYRPLVLEKLIISGRERLTHIHSLP